MNPVIQLAKRSDLLAAVDVIRDCADDRGFAVIRGVIDRLEMKQYMDRVHAMFDPRKDRRVSGPYQWASPDFQRLDLGEYPASARFARYFFFFPWNNDEVFGDIGELQMTLLGRLAGKPDTFGAWGRDPNPERFRLTFVIQYPAGGGFMSKHREYAGQEDGDRAYVVYLALTTRGEDFTTGGGYVYRGEDKIDIESYTQAADLVVYRGDMYHGVDGVDREAAIDLSALGGRFMLTTAVKYSPASR